MTMKTEKLLERERGVMRGEIMRVILDSPELLTKMDKRDVLVAGFCVAKGKKLDMPEHRFGNLQCDMGLEEDSAYGNIGARPIGIEFSDAGSKNFIVIGYKKDNDENEGFIPTFSVYKTYHWGEWAWRYGALFAPTEERRWLQNSSTWEVSREINTREPHEQQAKVMSLLRHKALME